jgi:penicillin-binding protein 1A
MKLTTKVFVTVLASSFTAVIAGGALLYSYYSSLSLTNLKLNLNESTLVYDSQGVLLDEIHGEEHRKVISLKNIDKDIQQAIISIEDKNFYKHNGVSFKGIFRAAAKNISTRSVSEGASTITMQLAKVSIGNTQDRTLSNKVIEMMYAIQLEQVLSKEEILELYLNTIYWGNNTYGIETATETYFNKSSASVEPHEAAMLAALIQNPSRYNPYNKDKTSYSLLKNRQKEVLRNIGGYYTTCYSDRESFNTKTQRINCIESWVNSELNKSLNLTGKKTWQKSKQGYVTDMAVNEAIDILKDVNTIEDLKVKGYKIYSTVNNKHQELAINAVNNFKGYKGGAQFALTAINPNTNQVIAIVGGTDYNKSPLNRAIGEGGLKGRQPGSSIKPYIYYQAMLDYSPEDQLSDEPFCVNSMWSAPYCPKNYGGDFSGPDTLQNHLAKSRNIPAVKLSLNIGISNVIKTMKSLGISTPLENIASFALGSNNLIPIEHTNAYAAFANGGYYSPYTSISKIINKEGEIVYQYTNKQEKVLDTEATNKLNQMLRYTVTNGTATAANVPGLKVMGKTGTTDKNSDVLCQAYTSSISTGLWIGHDDYNKRLYGATGGQWACPVLGNFLLNMKNNNYIK